MRFSELKIGEAFETERTGGLLLKISQYRALIINSVNTVYAMAAGQICDCATNKVIPRVLSEFPPEYLQPGWMVESDKKERGVVLNNKHIFWYSITSSNGVCISGVRFCPALTKVWAIDNGPKCSTDLVPTERTIIWEAPKVLQVTKQAVADKFGVSVDLLEIV